MMTIIRHHMQIKMPTHIIIKQLKSGNHDKLIIIVKNIKKYQKNAKGISKLIWRTKSRIKMARLILSGTEAQASDSFKKEHKNCKETFKNSISLPFQYLVGLTNIGNTVKIICPYCNESKDITDVDCW